VAFAPGSGPIIPTVHAADRKVIDAGTNTAVTLTGASFTNITGANQYVSDVALTAADGSSVTLTPDLLDQGSMSVTIPGETAPGNYDVRAVKEAAGGSTVTISGSGFAGYAAGSGTSVTGTVTTVRGGRKKTKTVDAAIVSWSDTAIEADFGVGTIPNAVTVNSVFGSDTSQIRRGGISRRRR
jgi:hypothetical protein